MMIYGVRNAARTRVRLQREPFNRPWPGWEEREGEVNEALFTELEVTTDTVRLEQLHQEIFLGLTKVS